MSKTQTIPSNDYEKNKLEKEKDKGKDVLNMPIIDLIIIILNRLDMIDNNNLLKQ